MPKKPARYFRTILRALSVIALLMYVLFLTEEDVPLRNSGSFVHSSVYLLFLVFVIGLILLWRNELISGIIFVFWYGLQWALVFWVWDDGELTLILGLPIGLLGILITVYAFWLKKSSKPDGQQLSH